MKNPPRSIRNDYDLVFFNFFGPFCMKRARTLIYLRLVLGIDDSKTTACLVVFIEKPHPDEAKHCRPDAFTAKTLSYS